MKLSYKILWIDDEIDSIEDDRKDIVEFLEGFGIDADISTIPDRNSGGQSIRDSVREKIKNPELDILLVDYHMEDMEGDKLVDEIRNTDHVFLPVIFYSADTFEAILEAASRARLDGVYFAQRDYLVQKFKDVAQSLLRKEHTIKRTRGLLMEEVSEIDAKFRDIYEQVWGRLPRIKRQKLIKYIKQRIIERRAKEAKKKSEDFPTDLEDFSCHMNEKFLSPSYDMHTRWRILCKMLEYLENNGDNQKVFLELYGVEDSLLERRNIYAHSTRRELQEKHSEDICIEIRREIRRQHDSVDYILDSVSHFPKV